MAEHTPRHGAFTTNTMLSLDRPHTVESYADGEGEIVLTIEAGAYHEGGSGSMRLLLYGQPEAAQEFVRAVTAALAEALAESATVADSPTLRPVDS